MHVPRLLLQPKLAAAARTPTRLSLPYILDPRATRKRLTQPPNQPCFQVLFPLTLVSELSTDFTKWPTVKQFTSWLGLCPNWKKTGGKVKSSHTRKGRAAPRLSSGGVEPARSKSLFHQAEIGPRVRRAKQGRAAECWTPCRSSLLRASDSRHPHPFRNRL